MLMLFLNVVYLLVSIAMIVLILLQRGSGAAAGSGFGAGASGTVFGARGASSFMTKTTKWLAVVFFGISLFMAWHAIRYSHPEVQQDLGVMSQPAATAPAATVPAPAPGEMPAPPPAADASVPAPVDASVPQPEGEAAPPAQ